MLLLEKNLILASKSPRRQELLKGLDIAFRVESKETDESYPPDMDISKVALYLAEKKAKAFLPFLGKEDLVLTADTVVIIDGEILEKPVDKQHAKQMLQTLSGKKHLVITGVCMRDTDKMVSFDDLTEVYFAPLTATEIEYYIDRFQPFDKAGSYGVQEWIGYVAVYKMEGSFYNVMGLPVHKVYEQLKKW